MNFRAMFLDPRMKNCRVMEACIIQDQNDLSARSGVTKKNSQKDLRSFGVKGCHGERHEAAIGRTNSPEDGHGLSGRRMIEHEIGGLGGNPHDTPRAVLLKMTFIGKPQVDVLSFCQFSEFFYMRLWPQNRPERSRLGVCADGIPVGGTPSGIDERPYRSNRRTLYDGSTAFPPKSSGHSLRVADLAGDPGRWPEECSLIRSRADRAFRLLRVRRSRYSGSGGSSTGPLSRFAPNDRRFLKNSCPSRKEVRRGAGGHNEILQTAGFHSGWQSA